MPVPDARGLRDLSAIEALEHVRQIRRSDARAVITDLDDQSVVGQAGRDVDRRLPAGEYWLAFSSRWASAVAVKRGSSRTGTSRSMCTRSSRSCRVCSTCSRAAATISDGCVQRDSAVTAPASIRAISRMF